MATRTLHLNSRMLAVAGLAQDRVDMSSKPVAVLLPAHNNQDVARSLAVIEALVGNGCRELCCAGPQAELLHDQLDTCLESRGWVDVVTTFHLVDRDACEYFLFAANGATGNLLALVEDSPLLMESLQAELDSLE